MPAPISMDLRLRVVRAVEGGSSIREAARRFAVSPSAAIKLMQRVRPRQRRTGALRRPPAAGAGTARSRPAPAGRGDARPHPRQPRPAAAARRSAAGLSTIHNTLRRIGLRHKKSPESRRAGPARRRRQAPAVAQLATLHGSGVVRLHRRDRDRHQTGAALRPQSLGWRLVAAVPHGHWRTTTLIAGLRQSGIVAPLVLDGPMTGLAFLAYVEQFLAPALAPGDVVVLDNLAAHKVDGVRQAIAAAGGWILYMPPYSPDFNPIEQLFAKLKALAAQGRRPHQRGTLVHHRPPPRHLRLGRMHQLSPSLRL